MDRLTQARILVSSPALLEKVSSIGALLDLPAGKVLDLASSVRSWAQGEAQRHPDQARLYQKIAADPYPFIKEAMGVKPVSLTTLPRAAMKRVPRTTPTPIAGSEAFDVSLGRPKVKPTAAGKAKQGKNAAIAEAQGGIDVDLGNFGKPPALVGGKPN